MLQTTVFAQSLSNFTSKLFMMRGGITCKLFMVRGGTLLVLGDRIKGQGQLLRSLYKDLWT